MEYAIGKILYISGTIARINVLFYSTNGYWSSTKIEDHFPETGRVFAPSLPLDYPFLKNDDIICFNYVENPMESSRDDDDFFIVPRKKDGGLVWKCPYIATNITEDDIFNRIGYSTEKELIFFTTRQGAKNFICGPVWSNNLSPKTGKEVKGWSYREYYDTITDPDTGRKYLATESETLLKKEHQIVIDCMTASQLSEWMNEKLKNVIDYTTLKTFRNQIKEISEHEETDDLCKKRFARIRKSTEILQFTWSELQTLRDIPSFQNVINTAIQKQLDNILVTDHVQLNAKRKQIQEEFSLWENDIKLKKKNGEEKIRELNTTIENLNKQYIKKEELLKDQEKSIKELSDKRSEIIENLKLQAEIMGFSSHHKSNSVWNYPLEYITRNPDAKPVSNNTKDMFCDRVNESLELQQGFMRRALTHIRQYDIVKTTDIRTGVFLANVLGNSIYQLCQPSPQWISFKEFWDESLNSIWDSAHDNPDVWHFLLIDNFNIALPECWGMPLWNIFSGKTTVLPCANNPKYPRNLRIIVSLAPTESEDNSHIGLLTHVDTQWKLLDPNSAWDVDDCWEKFVEDRDSGVAVNEEFFYPVG